MPSVEWNIDVWNKTYDWSRGGEEWSGSWGGAEMQWHGSLLPRIHPFLPAGSILEIAPGYGRWTHYLKDLCQDLTLVDVSEQCIQKCRQRFSDCTHIKYAVNDGKSLEMVPEESVDFVFSFDSLVHAPPEVMEAYLRQLAGKLKPGGAGFIHHSNAGNFSTYFSMVAKLPRGRRWLTARGILNHDHWRDQQMTAGFFRETCARVGLGCPSQELINWEGRMLIDCFSVFTRKGSPWDRPLRLVENRGFMHEADNLRRIAPLYSRGSAPQPAPVDK